jgi:predicted deacetylase
MYFCIRDDDTSFFTSPEDLERVYGVLSQRGPVSLAVVPFHRAGTSKGVPERFRNRWSVHPLHENLPLVEYLREGVSAGRFEIMLHGYYHDERHGRPEFESGSDLTRRVAHGRAYLEELLGTTIRVFVPPRNAIGRRGLQAIATSGLQLGGTAGLRSGWSLISMRTWSLWMRLRRWRRAGGRGVPWVLDLGDHREIAGNAITPVSDMTHNEAAFESALAVGGVFCAATHYWEHAVPSVHDGHPPVGEQLHQLVERVVADSRIRWHSVGEVISNAARLSL